MGLIDFVVNAGQKLFGGESEAKAATATAAAGAPKPFDRGPVLENHVRQMGFDVEDLDITVDGMVATVAGKTATQEVREKVVLAVGNIAGIARVDDRIAVVTPEPEAVYYTVVRGDTLSKIAKQHYGNAMKYPVIFEANKPMLTDPDKIYPGQVLRIPPLSE